MFTAIRKFLREEDGPTAVEYAVLLAMIAVAVIGAVNQMANSTAASFNTSAQQINGAFGS